MMSLTAEIKNNNLIPSNSVIRDKNIARGNIQSPEKIGVK